MPVGYWIFCIIFTNSFFPSLSRSLDINYVPSTDELDNGTVAQYCPDGCLCIPSTTGASIITCSCKNEFAGLRINTSPPLVTIPLGGDYADGDNDFKSEATEYQANGSGAPAHLYFPADVFPAFGGRIGLVIVHGCKRVTVAGWAFRDAEVVEQLKFTDIGHLTFEPHALSGLQKAPKQIVVQNSYVDVISAHAFSGLSDVEHIWWRNSTIGRIAKLAFFKNILLRRVGDFVLLNTKVNEVIIEDARLNTTSYSFLGLRARRVSLRNCAWLVSNQRNAISEAMKRRIPHQDVDELNVQNTTVDSILLAHFYNISKISIVDSQIGDLQSLQPDHPFGGLIAFNIDSIIFRSCRIARWLSHSFSDAHKIGDLSFVDSQILFIARSAVHNSRIDVLRFAQTRLKLISANAFSHNRIRCADLEAVEVGTAGDAIFYRSQLEQLSVRNSRIHAEQANIFAEMSDCKMCEVVACSFAGFPTKMFDNATIVSLTIRDSEFEGVFRASALANLHTDGLLVTRSVFACNPKACEDNALLLHKTIHDNVAWIFTNNKCVPQRDPSISITTTPSEDIGNEGTTINDIEYALLTSSETMNDDGRYEDYRMSEKICAQELETVSESSNSGIICRRRALIEECICLQPSKKDGTLQSSNDVIIPDTTAKILLVGDCPRLSFKASEVVEAARMFYSQLTDKQDTLKSDRPNLEFLYLYRIDALRLDADFDATLRHLSVLYSNINITGQRAAEKHGAVKNTSRAHIRNFLISGSIVETIGEYAFALTKSINSIVFNRTIVRYMSPNAFSLSQVKRVELWYSDLLTSADMLEHVDEMRIEQSRIAQPQITQTSMANISFSSLAPYDLCLLRSTSKAEHSECQKCLRVDGCAEYMANAATAPGSIIKRCAHVYDCEDQYISRNIIDFYVSDVSAAIFPNLASHLTASYLSGFLITKVIFIHYIL